MNGVPTSAYGEPVRLTTCAGEKFCGRLFENRRPSEGPAVLIAGAVAVPQNYYRHFAAALIAAGARAVLTFDYRGVGASRPARLRGYNVRMKDWALEDFPAAAEALQSRFPGTGMVGVGHSFGGQALGLSGIADRFLRYAAVATLSGYWRGTDEPLKVYATMNLLGVPLTWLLGYLPAAAGLGEDIPAQVFRDWARWCRSPDYFFSDPGLPETVRFSDVRSPLLIAGMRDDKWATERATRALTERYANAPKTYRWFTQQEAGRAIGHFGFFKPNMAESLWPEVIAWLVRGETR